MGAKNHGIVMPDANVDATLNALVAAGFGAAGQRCMALSTVVFIGDSKSWYLSSYLLDIKSCFFLIFSIINESNQVSVRLVDFVVFLLCRVKYIHCSFLTIALRI